MKLINSVLEDVKNPYICIESLRNTCSELLDRIPEFVRARVEFTHIRSVSFVERALLWWSFGVNERMVEDVAAMDPLWENGRLWVNADFEHDEKVYDSLEVIIAYMFQFQSVSDTRWVKSCSSSRLELRSFAVGLPGLVEHVKADKTVGLE